MTKQRYFGQLGMAQLKETVLNAIQQQVSKELGKLIFRPKDKLFADSVVIPILSNDGKTFHYYRNVRCYIFPLFDAFQAEDVEKHLIEALRDCAVSQRNEPLIIEQVDDTVLFYEII